MNRTRPFAVLAVSNTTGAETQTVRAFPDSAHGRHLADESTMA